MELLIETFDAFAKVGAGIVVLFGCLTLFFPKSVLPLFEAYIASNRGLQGFVYYEISSDNEKTSDAQLLLLGRDSSELGELATVDTIRYGDKLIVHSRQWMRALPNKDATKLYTLERGECVIVIGESTILKTQEAISGGWLSVATSNCGIFN
ncbi:hypothetical protein E4634_00545 [Mangrovimicrobium sediminis]|uniref:Uncharacterized protein n=1 Tax=Mangrovimicrobium sediminis TaxID=2562682 RepID=A0A4Z0M8P4_9GAMM|nr:hypothetical protein [Haliea sp. SAOS-164]TGD76073.1 hypothetical protein E4634_00545 [Haliea sp. SAOS-164]